MRQMPLLVRELGRCTNGDQGNQHSAENKCCSLAFGMKR